MKEKPSEWVSISDLMAGVMAVVMLLLVVSVVKSSIEMQEIKDHQEKGVKSALKEIKTTIANKKISNKIQVTDSVLLLSDKSFESGSACLSTDVKHILETEIAPILSRKLIEYKQITVQIEGHTDAQPVKGVIIDLKGKCALYDDNYSLSAGRAREARKAVLIGVQNDTSISRRISVVGFGPDRLLNTLDTSAAENRRVEIRLISRTD